MRLRALDGARGIAILAVMANHTGVPSARGGYLGVDLFFVLSGYLITTIVLRERARTGRVSLARFYARRLLRLYPALLLTCAVALIIPFRLGFHDRAESLRGVGTALAYLQDIAINVGWDTGTPLFHTWTLAIEEHFYLLFPPVLVALLTYANRRGVIGVLVAGLAWSVVVLVVAFDPSSSPTSVVYYRPDARAGALLLGCLLALALERSRRSVPPWAGCAGLIALLGVLLAAPEANTRSAFWLFIPVAWLASAALVAGIVTAPDGRLSRMLSWAPLSITGLISYGLYLYHPLVNDLVSRHVSSRHVGAPIAIVLSFVVAGLSYRYFESWFLARKAKFASAGAVEPAAQAIAACHR